MRALDASHFLLGLTWRDKEDRGPSFPFSLPAVRDLEKLKFHPNVTFFVGENGAGKSTILEAIAILMGCNAEGGSQNFGFSTVESHTRLHDHLRPIRSVRRPRSKFFLRAESYFNVATKIDQLDAEPGGPKIIDSYGGVSLHHQSHGESFMALMMNRFSTDGLYFLDEPEAALSPTRQMAMIARMHDLVSDGAQFIVATHSPILLAYPQSSIYLFDSSGVNLCAYEDTEHYRITKDFLSNYALRLKDLLAD